MEGFMLAESDPSLPAHQAENNKPHLTYFDEARDVSFVWNGTQGNLVDVCPKGYGEPARGQFTIGFEQFETISLRTAIDIFQAHCQRWLTLHPEIGQPA